LSRKTESVAMADEELLVDERVAGMKTFGLVNRGNNRAATPPYLAEGASNQRVVSLSSIINPSFEHKMRAQWSQVRDAFLKLDRDRSGTLNKEELWHCLHNIFHMPLSVPEFNRLFRYFDDDDSGEVSYEEFNTKIAGLFHVKEEGGVGYSLQERGTRREFGRCRDLTGLGPHVKWNNVYRQQLDPNGKQTQVKSIVDGNYYLEEKKLPPRSGRQANHRDYDEQRNQPLITSLMTGLYYGEKEKPHTSMSNYFRRSFILRNIQRCRTTTPRNRTGLGARRFPSAPSGEHKAYEPENFPPKASRPRPQTAHVSGRYATRDALSADFQHTTLANPRNPQTPRELEVALNRKISDSDARPMLQWLKSATPEERHKYFAAAKHTGGTAKQASSMSPRPPTRPLTSRGGRRVMTCENTSPTSMGMTPRPPTSGSQTAR